MASTSKMNPEEINVNHLHLRDAAIKSMKDEYNDKLEAYYSVTPPEPGEKYLKTNLSNHDLLDILVERKIAVADRTSTRKDDDFDSKDLYTAFVNGKERLVTKFYSGKYKVIIPREDLFDVVWLSHTENNHPEPKTLMDILQENYTINKFAVHCINEVCIICTGEAKPYVRCSVDILPMALNQDFAFTNIMVYEDLYTGFMHFRPLSMDTMQTEICLKLFRLFMDFGPPTKLVTSDKIFAVAIDQVKELTKGLPFHVKIRQQVTNTERINYLITRVMQWMKANESTHWAIGCYALQLEMNNEINGEDQKSPFTKVFRSLNDTIKFTSEDIQDTNHDTFYVIPSTPAADPGVIRSSPATDPDVIPSSPAADPDVITDFIYPGDPDDLTNVALDEKDPLAID